MTSSPTSSTTALPSSSHASTLAPRARPWSSPRETGSSGTPPTNAVHMSGPPREPPGVARKQRPAADERRALVGPAAGREQPGVVADVLVDPPEALGREGRAGRADVAQRGQVAAVAGLDLGLHAGGDVGRT